MLKNLIAFLALIGVGLSKLATEECTEGLSADPKNPCSGIYYQCVHGAPMKRDCPADLKFNEAKNQCDYSKNVAACKDTESEAGGCTDGLNVDPENACSGTFYQCSNGVSTKMTCPGTLKFNAAQGYCDYDANIAACGTTEPNEVTEAPSCNHEDLIMDTECSNIFYQCDNGNKVKKECPADLIFDGTRCEWRSNVEGCKEHPKQYARVCEHAKMALLCPWGKSINILTANYGRTEGKEVCPHLLIKSTDCRADSSMDVMSKACSGKSLCLVSASNKVFGDPCFLTYKYLEVEYECT